MVYRVLPLPPELVLSPLDSPFPPLDLMFLILETAPSRVTTRFLRFLALLSALPTRSGPGTARSLRERTGSRALWSLDLSFRRLVWTESGRRRSPSIVAIVESTRSVSTSPRVLNSFVTFSLVFVGLMCRTQVLIQLSPLVCHEEEI